MLLRSVHTRYVTLVRSTVKKKKKYVNEILPIIVIAYRTLPRQKKKKKNNKKAEKNYSIFTTFLCNVKILFNVSHVERKKNTHEQFH